MRYFLLTLCLTLAGCTSDSYVKDVPQDRAAADLQQCHKKTFDAYNAQNKNDPTGAVVGGVLGGAIGGAVAGVMTSSYDDKIDLNKAIQNCMRAKGYTGDSRGYN